MKTRCFSRVLVLILLGGIVPTTPMLAQVQQDQPEACDEGLLIQADRLYDLGFFPEVIALLDPCFPEDFPTKEQNTRALRFAALAYYVMDDLNKARQTIADLISVDRRYRADSETDPLFFQAQVEELRRPRFYQKRLFQLVAAAALGGGGAWLLLSQGGSEPLLPPPGFPLPDR